MVRIARASAHSRMLWYEKSDVAAESAQRNSCRGDENVLFWQWGAARLCAAHRQYRMAGVYYGARASRRHEMPCRGDGMAAGKKAA